MRSYTPRWITQHGISPSRYAELRAFCRQYPEWKVEAASMLGTAGAGTESAPRGSEPGDPTGRAVERRERILAKIALVESCAAAIDGGRWYQALILNACNGMSYDCIRDLHPATLRTSMVGQFFKARHAFFCLLDQRMG